MSEVKKYGVFLVDDHPVVRRGLAECINTEKDLEVVGEADDVDSSLREIATKKPDIIIVDITLGGLNGIDLTRAIKTSFNIPVLMLSIHDETLYAERAMKAGARGYIMKKESIDTVITAIRDILGGKIFLSPAMKERLLGKYLSGAPVSSFSGSVLDDLTNREMEVFQYIGQGLSYKHIAKNLGLSTKTVETYRTRIMAKLNLRSSSELLQFAIQWIKNNDSVIE